MFHHMGIRMSVVFKEETNCWCFGALSEIASGLSKELKSSVITHVPVSSALSYPAALLLSMRRFCVRMKHTLWCGRRIKEKELEWYCEAPWFEYLIQSKDPFARRACAIGTITMLLFPTEVLLSPDFQMMCPGVLQVNACTNRENSKVLSDGRMVIGLFFGVSWIEWWKCKYKGKKVFNAVSWKPSRRKRHSMWCLVFPYYAGMTLGVWWHQWLMAWTPGGKW